MQRDTASGILVLMLIGTIFLQQLSPSNVSPNSCCSRQVTPVSLGLVSASGYFDVNVSEAKQLIESDVNLTILDVRTLAEYESGHIQNATFIPLAELAGRLGELDKEKEILVYCAAGGRSATASQVLANNGFLHVYNMLGGITAWRSAGYWIEIIHKGDLIINRTQTYLIENTTFFVEGNIIVEDDANLIIRNAHMTMNTTYRGEFRGYIRDRAHLEVENSVLEDTYPEQTDLSIEGDASLTVTSSHFYLRIWGTTSSRIAINSSTVYRGVSVISASVDIVGSEIYHGIGLYLTEDDPDLELDGLKRSQMIPSLHFESGKKALNLENTMVGWWKINLDFGYKSSLTIKNSQIQEIWTTFDKPVNVSDMKPGYFENWNVHENVEGPIPWNLTLVNTELQDKWKLIFYGDAYLENVKAQLDPWNDKTVIVKDSEIVYLDARGSKYLKFTNCVIDNWELDGLWEHGPFESGNFFIELETSVIKASDLFSVAMRFCFIKGTVTMQLPPYRVNFQKGILVREYPLIVKDIHDNLLPYVLINLIDSEGRLAWNGTTNDQGIALFNVTFTKENYADTLKLEAVKGEYSALTNVGFLSDTPVVLTMRYLTDLNRDGKVNILDITLVAAAYGSTPDSVKWNEAADLNKDGVINILDISLVAKDYGKTV